MRKLSPNVASGLDLSALGATVLQPEDVLCCRDAETAVQCAKDEAAIIRHDAALLRKDWEQQARQLGFNAGLADGRAEITAQQQALARLQSSRQADTLDLAYAIIERLFGDWSPAQKLVGCLHEALDSHATSSGLKIAVRPEDKGTLERLMPSDADFVVDPSLPENSARLSSELGVITVSFERQLNLIRDTLLAQMVQQKDVSQ